MTGSLAESVVRARTPIWRDYVSLFRFRYHISFLVVLVGSLSVKLRLGVELAALYVSFNILLYGGIYTLHAVSDADLDRLHSRKRFRPIASGAISERQAIALGWLLISAGLLSSQVWFSAPVVAVFIGAIFCNGLYSGVGRNIPYLEVALNAGTYPLRFLLGVVVAGGRISLAPLFLTFLVAAGGVTLRRRLELRFGGVVARPAMAAYSPDILRIIEVALFVAIGGLWLVDSGSPDVFYWMAAAVYAMAILLPGAFPPARRLWERYWSV